MAQSSVLGVVPSSFAKLEKKHTWGNVRPEMMRQFPCMLETYKL